MLCSHQCANELVLKIPRNVFLYALKNMLALPQVPLFDAKKINEDVQLKRNIRCCQQFNNKGNERN